MGHGPGLPHSHHLSQPGQCPGLRRNGVLDVLHQGGGYPGHDCPRRLAHLAGQPAVTAEFQQPLGLRRHPAQGHLGLLPGHGDGHLFLRRRRTHRHHGRRSGKSRTVPAQGHQPDYLAYPRLLHRHDGRHHDFVAVEPDWHPEQSFRPDFHQRRLPGSGQSPQLRRPGCGHFRL